MYAGHADRFEIDVDETGFNLVVYTDLAPDADSEAVYRFHMGGVAEELHDTVKREIGPWLYERDQAKREFDRTIAFECDPDEGYSRDDPKHPDWHSVHADIYDQRADK